MSVDRRKPKGLHLVPSIESHKRPSLISRVDKTSFWAIRVLVLGCDIEHRAWLRNSLRQIGVRVVAVAPKLTQLASVVEMCKSFTHVIVNLDGYACITDGADALSTFRKCVPDVLIIVISSGETCNAHSVVCDVTLCPPMTERLLRKALLVDRKNRIPNCPPKDSSL